MLRKSFVSISFASQGRIHILELNASRSKVKNKFMADLPPGIISEYKVVDVGKLALILRDVWDKFKIREKSVGIVVPEFATYTKVITIPKLERKEIDEAIQWQFQDSLPEDLSHYVVDWKILAEVDGEHQILAVAVEREILEGYVSASDKAGLFPIAVETPSLSLVRFVSHTNEPNLVLYLGNSQFLAVISKGQRIYTSSVTHPDGMDTIVKNSKQMINHYSDVSISRIYVGGQEVNQKVLDEISKAFEVPIELIDYKIKGLTDEDKQKFLITVSMQYKNPLEPADEHTINMLPENQVYKYRIAKLKLQIWSLSLTMSLFIWVSFLTVVSTYLFLSQSLDSFKQSVNPNRTIIEMRDGLVGTIDEVNAKSNKIIKINSDWIYPQSIINSIVSAQPTGVRIDEYSINFETGAVKLKGFARIREDVIEFKQELEKNPEIKDISIPISSFEKDRDLNFDLSFNYVE